MACQLRIATSFGDPTGQQKITVEMQPSTGKSFYRVFHDQNNLAVYAYELMVDRSDDQYHLTVRAAGDKFAQLHPEADGGKPVPTLSAPLEFPDVRSGQPFSFDVFNTPGQGEKVTDTVTLTIDQGAASHGGSLRFGNLRVFINKTLSPGAASSITVSGKYAMFYIPGQGGFFFSSESIPGKPFVEAGWVDRDRMQFTIDNVTYDANSSAPILTQSDRGELWVYHDPNYLPAGNWTKPLNDPTAENRPPGFFTAASNTLSWWIQ